MPESEGGYKEFLLEDLFVASNGDTDIQASHINGLGVPVVSSGTKNNGIIGLSDIDAKVFEPDTITIDMFGNRFYQKNKYKLVTHARIFSLSPLGFQLNEKRGLYFVAQFSFVNKLFSYGNMASWQKIKNYKLSLPILRNGEINWSSIETFVEKIIKSREKELNNYYDTNGYSDCTLTDKEQHALASLTTDSVPMNNKRLGTMFDIHPTKTYKGTNSTLFATKGNNPIVVNSSTDNGIGGRVALPTTERGNKITFSDTTTSDTIFYQPDDFIGYSHVQALYEKEHNWRQNELLYLLAAFKKNAKGRFDYATKFTRLLASNMHICLPVTSNGSIDYDFMETYINALKKQCVARLKASDVFVDTL